MIDMSFIPKINSFFVSKFRDSIDYIISRSQKNAIFIPSGFLFLVSSGGVILSSLFYQGRFIFYGEVETSVSVIFLILIALFLLLVIWFSLYGYFILFHDSNMRHKIYSLGNYSTPARKQNSLRILFIILMLINAVLICILLFSLILFFIFYNSAGTF